jgi:hypothetical protein
MFDPRVLSYIQSIAISNRISISDLIEQCILRAFDAKQINDLQLEENTTKTVTHNTNTVTPQVELAALNREFLILLDKSLTKDLSEKNNARKEYLWQQIQILKA